MSNGNSVQCSNTISEQPLHYVCPCRTLFSTYVCVYNPYYVSNRYCSISIHNSKLFSTDSWQLCYTTHEAYKALVDTGVGILRAFPDPFRPVLVIFSLFMLMLDIPRQWSRRRPDNKIYMCTSTYTSYSSLCSSE